MIHGVHHVAIHTADLDRIVRFYTEGLGFTPTGPAVSWSDAPDFDAVLELRDTAARAQMLRAGNCHIEVFEYAKPLGRVGEPLRPHDHGYTHFALSVSDIEGEIERLKGHGMVFPEVDLLEMDSLKAIIGKDPDGNLIELLQLDADHEYSARWLDAAERD
jgi:catechol 2,3-dioxygenase-like lactoylglutathione lyase family enzyme